MFILRVIIAIIFGTYISVLHTIVAADVMSDGPTRRERTVARIAVFVATVVVLMALRFAFRN